MDKCSAKTLAGEQLPSEVCRGGYVMAVEGFGRENHHLIHWEKTVVLDHNMGQDEGGPAHPDDTLYTVRKGLSFEPAICYLSFRWVIISHA